MEKQISKKIIYIVGTPRCGSTLLGNVLNEYKSFIHVGELRFIIERGINDNWVCGDGKPFTESTFWKRVVRRVLEQNGKFSEFSINEIEKTFLRNLKKLRYRNYFLWNKRKVNYNFKMINSEYLIFLKSLYSAIFEISNAEIIIDTSKNPQYGYLLSFLSDFEVSYIHLIRKSKAVVFSQTKRKKKQTISMGNSLKMGGNLSLLISAKNWTKINLLAHRLLSNKKYKLIHYEKFVEEPIVTIKMIFDFINESQEPEIIFNENKVILNPNIVFSGNPDRFESGEVKIQADNVWKNKLTQLEKSKITLVTLPYYFKYIL